MREERIRFGMASNTEQKAPTRQTRQRSAVRAVLIAAARPLTPEEIRAAATRRVRGLGIATVYRALRMQVDAGEVVVVEVAGATPRYEWAGRGHHHHFHCRGCERLFEVDGCPGDVARIAPTGFSVERHDLTLFGLCPDCTTRPAPRR
jgi:Fur family ferric uptake transcriptional regulator